MLIVIVNFVMVGRFSGSIFRKIEKKFRKAIEKRKRKGKNFRKEMIVHGEY